MRTYCTTQWKGILLIGAQSSYLEAPLTFFTKRHVFVINLTVDEILSFCENLTYNIRTDRSE